MELGPVLTFAGVVATALLTAAVTFYTTRSKAKTDLQASLIAGFGAITDQLQEERKELQSLVKEARTEIESLKATVDSKNRQVDHLKIDLRYTQIYIGQLEHLLNAAQIQLPSRQARLLIDEDKEKKS